MGNVQTDPSDLSAVAAGNRDRVLAAATRLLAEGGRDAISTRAVATGAGLQAPVIYRLFGDKQGLLDAVAAHVFEAYLGSKAVSPHTGDPVEDLREGWDLHVEFGLANPATYALIYGDPRSDAVPAPAARAANKILADSIHAVAAAGRLRVSEAHAVQLIRSTGAGVTLALIALPEERRDLTLSVLAREAVIAAITTTAPTPARPGARAAAIALRAQLAQTTALSASELSLLRDWLDRIAAEH